jgi:protoporphyrin/coproporphyrin ferrochelatase
VTTTAVLLLHFGEPEQPVLDEVVPFLERIFGLNASLEQHGRSQAGARTSELAAARAPGLISDYERIGGSPLHAQARAQRAALESELLDRGGDVAVFTGMQFTPPFIADAIRQARAADATRLVALPIYPLCGPSTTVAALDRVAADIAQQLWSIPVHYISGWHRHPAYTALRANAIRTVLDANSLSLDDPRTTLVFSAHGTPMKYIREGSRYDLYVADYCTSVAGALGADKWALGFQNHTNRPIEWTEPNIEQVIDTIDADRIVVDAASFMHEQSETLSELDIELRSRTEGRGIAFHRVPVPHDSPAFIGMLADLVTSVVEQPPALLACKCRPGAMCLNASLQYPRP